MGTPGTCCGLLRINARCPKGSRQESRRPKGRAPPHHLGVLARRSSVKSLGEQFAPWRARTHDSGIHFLAGVAGGVVLVLLPPFVVLAPLDAGSRKLS